MIQVIIPTYNRPLCIQYLIEKSLNQYTGDLFEFLVLDSSTNEETQKLIDRLGYKSNLIYQKIDSAVQPDDKVINAVTACRTEYYWLFGDGNLADFNAIESILKNLAYSQYDVVEIENATSKRNLKGGKEGFFREEDLIAYIASNFTHLTYWGATIIKTEKAKYLFKSGRMDKYRQDELSWWCACLICEMIDYQGVEDTSIGIFYTKDLAGNPGKRDRSWAKGEKYFITTFEVFNRDVDMLPSLFEPVKCKIIKNFRDDCLVRKGYLIQLKLDNVLKPEYVWKYRKDIQAVEGYYLFMLTLSITPDFLLKAIRGLYKTVKRKIK